MHQSSEPKTARIPRCAKVTPIGWLQSARTLCGEFGTPPRANSGGMVGVRPLLTACGDPAVGSFALLALLAPVSEYGQVAIDTRAAESPRWSWIPLTGSTPSRCKVIFLSTSACNCGGIRRRVFIDASHLKRMRCPTSVQLSVRRWRFLLRLTLVRAEEQVPGATSLGRSC